MAIATQTLGAAGGAPAATTPTYAVPLASDTIVPSPKTFLHVKVGATATTITLDAVQPCSMGFDHDLVVGPLTSTERMIGPIDGRYARSSDGLAAVTFSQVVGVTVAVIAQQ